MDLRCYINSSRLTLISHNLNVLRCLSPLKAYNFNNYCILFPKIKDRFGEYVKTVVFFFKYVEGFVNLTNITNLTFIEFNILFEETDILESYVKYKLNFHVFLHYNNTKKILDTYLLSNKV